MRNIETNTVISLGLVIMGIMSVAGWIVLSVRTGTSSGTEIPIAIISGLVGVLTGKHMAEDGKGSILNGKNIDRGAGGS